MKKFYALAITIVVILNLSSNGYSQIIKEDQLSRVDSLILILEFDKVTEFFIQKDAELENLNTSAKELEEYRTMRLNYDNLLKLMKELNYITEGRRTILIRQYMKYDNKFTESYAGKNAAISYQKFKILADENKSINALKYYRIAKYFMNMYFEYTKIKIENDLHFVEKLYSEKKYSEAKNIIQNTESIIKNNSTYNEYLSRTKLLEGKINYKLESSRINNDFWEQNKLTDNIFVIYISIHSIFIDKVKEDVIWESIFDSELSTSYINKNPEDIVFKAEEIRTEYTLGPSISVNAKVAPKIQIGFQYEKGKYSKIFVTKNNFHFDYEVDYSKIDLLGYYYFRETVGLRPYICLGTGLTIFKTKEIIKTGVLYNLSYKNYYYRLLEKNQKLNNLCTELGLEYISNSLSNIYYKFSFPVNYYFKKPDHVGYINIGFCISIGYAF